MDTNTNTNSKPEMEVVTITNKRSKIKAHPKRKQHNPTKLPGYNIPATTVIQAKALLRIGVPHRDIAAKLNIAENTVLRISKDDVTFKGVTAEDVSAAEEMFAATSMTGQQIAAEKITGMLLTDPTIKIDKAAFAMTQLAICREKAQGKQAKQSSQVTIILQIAQQRATIELSQAGFSDAVIIDDLPTP